MVSETLLLQAQTDRIIGIFLYAFLVLENLLEQFTKEYLLQELHVDKWPSDLGDV